MGLTRMIVKASVPLPKIEKYQRFLFIGPHPDDIEIGAGATAARLAAEGKDVCFLVCTDGRYGSGNFPAAKAPAEVASARRREAEKAAALLGVGDIRFLELSDGGFYTEDELLRGIAGVIGDFGPEVIFGPDPYVQSECHVDHLKVGRAVRRLACMAPYGGIMEQYGAKAAPVRAVAFYMTGSVNYRVKTNGYYETQQKALFESHLSQYPQGSDETSALQLYLNLRSREYGLLTGGKRGEGFRVLGATHMHCLPEAGK